MQARMGEGESGAEEAKDSWVTERPGGKEVGRVRLERRVSRGRGERLGKATESGAITAKHGSVLRARP